MEQINKLGIVCGSGELPERVIIAAKQQNIPFVLAAIKGFAKLSLIFNYEYFWASLGEVGTIAENFKKAGVSHVCFAGAVKRPSLFTLKLDVLGKELLLKYFKNISGDDSILSTIVKVYQERFGFIIISPQALDKTILSNVNFNSKLQPGVEQLEDIKIGFRAAKQIGALDIGQSIIVQQHLIIAIEGVEGTDNLIKRSKKLLKKVGSKAILVKVKKPQQEHRVDLPTIGLKTIKAIKKAGLAGLAIEDGSTLVLNQSEVLNYANLNHLFVITVSEDSL